MKDIKGYEGLYAITEDGKVWSYRRKIYLKPHTDCYHNLRIGLSQDGILTHFLVHRLVAEAYIPNPNGYDQVFHIDGNNANNCVDNLQWIAKKENVNYRKPKC